MKLRQYLDMLAAIRDSCDSVADLLNKQPHDVVAVDNGYATDLMLRLVECHGKLSHANAACSFVSWRPDLKEKRA